MTRTAALSLAAAAALVTAGCGGADAATTGDGDGLDVVAAFYPLQYAAERIAGDRASVALLTPPGAEAHDVELAPQDVAAVAEADLVVRLEGFQAAVDEAVVSAGAEDSAWDAGSAADLVAGAPGADDHADEHADEHAEDTSTADEHADDHAADALDPHFWLDPLRLAAVGDALAERLAEADPDGAQAYADGAADLRADLEALDAEAAERLADCDVRDLVTSHDAFGYLAERYGFAVVGISGLSPSQEPDPAEVAEIADLVRERGVTTVYTEALVDPAVAETVAAEAGATTAVLDPLEGLTDDAAGEDYLAVMRANLDVLAEGQACA